MTPVDLIRACEAAQSTGREVVLEQGLPCMVNEGPAQSRYAWEAGELSSLLEPDGCLWRYHYGGDGRLLGVEKDGRSWAEYGYDGQGRLLTVSRPEGSMQHTYDDKGRLVRTLRGDASPFLYQWEGLRVLCARSHHEETRFAYDEQGRPVALEQTIGGVTLTVRSIFNTQGRLGSLEFPEWGQRAAFQWDERGRPTSICWNDTEVARFGADDATRLAWCESLDGLREETWHDLPGGRPVRKVIRRLDAEPRILWDCEITRDEAFRITQEGDRSYGYDGSGRLAESQEGSRHWQYRQDLMDMPLTEEVGLERDGAGRLRLARQGAVERVFRYNQAGELLEILSDGRRIARCRYDHKGRLVEKTSESGVERYLYGVDDGLLAISDGEGRPRLLFLRLPIGVVALIDFRHNEKGRIVCLHSDMHGNLVFAGDPSGHLEGPFSCNPHGVPYRVPENLPYIYRGRLYHADLGLYCMGCRFYDPALRQFLTADTHTGAPDDERLVNPFRRGWEQRMARAQILTDWLSQPRLRNRFAYCLNDPVNRFDPDGHWSFGGVLLSLLGVLWTLPNTAFGLAVEVSCLVGEVVRWLVWLFSGGNATWQTPGFDVAASGRLNAFALVFKGGWLGSFDSLLGITFGNVIIVNGEYQNHPAFQALPDPVTPAAYGGAVTIPKSQALYEHELRHVNQYGWWGPFFHLGLPLFGIYEWDVILNGYQNASLEKDARDHGGF